jgi:predicted DNA-binding antitoxin AbrB/MazE fold protein
MQTIDAIYENGTLRPVEPLTGIANNTRVRVAVEHIFKAHPLSECFGILPDEDAAEMRQIVNDEFERIEPRDWS